MILISAASAAPREPGIVLSSTVDYLGPFPVGRTELDGDPCEAAGGIVRLHNERRAKALSMRIPPSELAPGGAVSWSTLRADSSGGVRVAPADIDWNALVQQLGDMAVLEHQGWAVLGLSASRSARALLRCTGVTAAFLHVAGSANVSTALTQFSGDIYGAGSIAAQFDLPATLKQQPHRIFVFVRAKVFTQFACSADEAPPAAAARDSIGARAAGLSVSLRVSSVLIAPDVLYDTGGRAASRTAGVLLGDALGSLVTARHGGTDQAVEDLRCVVEGGGATEEAQPVPLGLRINAGSGALALPCRFKLVSRKQACSSGGSPSVSLSVRVSGCVRDRGGGSCEPVSSPPLVHALRCRTAEQSATLSFMDHDGSVAAASVVLPLPLPGQPRGTPARPSPVLLTLHGTGVTGGGQADAYKTKSPGAAEYEFGVAGMWVLAPDRFGAHNWQGWGLHSAFAALQALAALTAASPELPPADPSRVLFAGHSMGGAGAWFASTAAPDLAIAAAPAAGWLVKASRHVTGSTGP